MKETNRVRPVAAVMARASASLASDPQWPSQTRLSPAPGVSASSSSANETASGLVTLMLLADAIVWTARVAASTTAGCA